MASAPEISSHVVAGTIARNPFPVNFRAEVVYILKRMLYIYMS